MTTVSQGTQLLVSTYIKMQLAKNYGCCSLQYNSCDLFFSHFLPVSLSTTFRKKKGNNSIQLQSQRKRTQNRETKTWLFRSRLPSTGTQTIMRDFEFIQSQVTLRSRALLRFYIYKGEVSSWVLFLCTATGD